MDTDKKACEYEAAKVVKEEIQKQYEEIKCLREEIERSLLDTRKQIYEFNKFHKHCLKDDESYLTRVDNIEARLADSYVKLLRNRVGLLEWEKFLKFVLSTSIFDDGEIHYIINDDITFSLKLERS